MQRMVLTLQISDDKMFSYLPPRVAKPVYTNEVPMTKPKGTWLLHHLACMTAARKAICPNRRGYDLTNVSPTAYDKLIFGLLASPVSEKLIKKTATS